MRELLHHRNGRQVERVAGVSLEGADAALAQDHIVVAAVHDVLSREQPLLDGGRGAALQQHRLAHLAQRLEQVVVLHVARAHLQDVHQLRHQRNLGVVHHLADDQQAVPVSSCAQPLQRRLAQALEAVRGGTRFEGATPQNLCSVAADGLGDGQDLLAALHRARPRHHYHFVAADLHVFPHLHHRAFGAKLPVGELVGGGNAMDLPHAFEQFDVASVKGQLFAHRGKYGARGAVGAVNAEAHLFQTLSRMLNLFFCRSCLHHNHHRLPRFRFFVFLRRDFSPAFIQSCAPRPRCTRTAASTAGC